MTEALIRDVEALTALLKAGGWRELRVECGGLSLLLSMDPDAGTTESIKDAGSMPVDATVSAPRETTRSGSNAPGVTANLDPAWHAVVAPNLGTFYRSPKPGAAPFVEIDQHIDADSEICLIEVMKLFTSVKAGVAGILRRIAATDAELVEGGQTLFYIERD